MSTMTFTTTCMTCGSIEDAEGPWNTSVVWCGGCTESKAKAPEVLAEVNRQKALQAEGRLLAGMGIYAWDRKRGAQTAERASARLVEIYAGLSMRDMLALKTLVDEEA